MEEEGLSQEQGQVSHQCAGGARSGARSWGAEGAHTG